jgi:hypothetical protein
MSSLLKNNLIYHELSIYKKINDESKKKKNTIKWGMTVEKNKYKK